MPEKELPQTWAEIRSISCEVFKQKKPTRADVWVDAGGGAETGTTMRYQRQVLDRIHLRMRAIHDIREVELATTFLNQSIKAPIAIAPMSTHISGFVDKPFAAMGRGAVAAGVLGSVGYPSSRDQHQDMLATGAPTCKIVKCLRDRDLLRKELLQAQQDGCFAVGVDIDSAAGLKPGGDERRYEDFSAFPSVRELTELRACTRLPFVVKGVMSVPDAVSAVQAGADLIVVSTHGGFALDYGEAPAEVMPEIVDAVGDKVEIWMDSGIRRGTDVLKALALGARGVLIGRLALWGLAVAGAEGVAHVIDLLAAELRRAMLLTGTRSVTSVSPDILVYS
ncbi:MAG TPA: alpha-hydroxy-acid oxidizing protein [Anaerolineae bacterium]|nr:alpha-hydroxy-acid oxidizing protein [Anaerolineae bacterium]